jgi:hypothetical protein
VDVELAPAVSCGRSACAPGNLAASGTGLAVIMAALSIKGMESAQVEFAMIRKLKSGQYRLYSRKLNPRTHKHRNLGTFDSRQAAEKHEREVQYFKRH